MKMYEGGGCIDSRILDLGTGCRTVLSFTPRPHYLRYPFNRRLGGSQNRSGRRAEERILPLPGLELWPFGRAASSQSLYRLTTQCYIIFFHV
jgi:hypothetical protein